MAPATSDRVSDIRAGHRRHAERKRQVLKRTQRENLIGHFKAGRSVSPVEAQVVYGIMRLAARVFDLEREGYSIKRVTRVDGKGQRYTRYSLVR